jgi:CspA family cold shock protein
MRYTGTVKWFNDAKGFGFITPDAGGSDVFVHFTGIRKNGNERRTLGDDDAVEFEIVRGDKGDQAADVVRVA